MPIASTSVQSRWSATCLSVYRLTEYVAPISFVKEMDDYEQEWQNMGKKATVSSLKLTPAFILGMTEKTQYIG